MTLITLKKVCKIYNRNTNLEVHALKNVSLDIKRGDFMNVFTPIRQLSYFLILTQHYIHLL